MQKYSILVYEGSLFSKMNEMLLFMVRRSGQEYAGSYNPLQIYLPYHFLFHGSPFKLGTHHVIWSHLDLVNWFFCLVRRSKKNTDLKKKVSTLYSQQLTETMFIFRLGLREVQPRWPTELKQRKWEKKNELEEIKGELW